MPYIGRDLNRGNYLKLDDISSSFNGNTKTFNLTSGGTAFIPGSSLSILVSVGGVILEPETAYQINNSEITFTTAPSGSDNFFCIVLGVALGVNTVADGTVNGAQVAKPFNYDNYFHLDSTNNRVGIGSLAPTQALDVSGTIKALNYSGPISNASGISTFYDLRVSNNLTVEGTTTTLDTNLIGVDRVEIDANSNTIVGVAVTQSGIADIVNLFDGATKVVTVDDTGNVGIGTDAPKQTLEVFSGAAGRSTFRHTGGFGGVQIAGPQTASGAALMFSRSYDVVGGGLTAYSLYMAGNTQGLHFVSGDPSEFATKTRLFLGSSGKIGIGTDNPTKKLDVKGTSQFQDDVTFTTANGNNIVLDKSTNGLDFGDNVSLRFGASSDLSIYHDQSVSRILDTYGHLLLNSNLIELKSNTDSKSYFSAVNGSHTKLFYNGNEKFATSGVGVTVFGNVVTNALSITTSFPAIYLYDTTADANDYRITNSDGTLRISDTTDSSNILHRFQISSDGDIISGIGSVSIGFNAIGQRKVDIVTGDDNGVLIRSTTAGEGSEGSADAIQDLIQLRNPWGSSAHNTGNAGARFGIQMRAYNGAGDFQTKDPAKSAAIYAVSEDEFSGYWKNVGLAFYTSAYNQSQAEKVRIDTNGNVGIGTNNPSQLIDVFKTTNDAVIKTRTTAAGAYFEADSANATGYHGLKLSTGGTVRWFLGSYNSNNFQIKDGSQASGIEAFTIQDGTGKVGIGTNNPDELLHIFSNTSNSKIVLESDNNSANNGIFWVDEGNNTQTEFYYSHPDNKQNLKVNGNGFEIYSKQTSSIIAKIGHGTGYNDMILSNGNFGIGTDDPAAKIEAFGTDASVLVHYNGHSRGGIAAFDTQRVAFVSTHVNDDLIFGYSNNPPSTANLVERMRIDNGTGNVGIGTASPDGKLHISSGTSGDCRVYIEADEDNNAEGDNPFIIFKNDGGYENASVWCGNADGGNDNSLNLSAATATGGGIRFFTSSTDGGWETADERLRIASNGVITGRGELRLTQGTSSVSDGAEIGSLMYLHPVADNKNAKIVALMNGGSSGADLAFYTRTQADATNNDGGEERLRITSIGEIGVNNANPSARVDFGYDSGQNSHAFMQFKGPNNKSGEMLHKHIINGASGGGTAVNLFEVTAWQSTNSRIFGVVKVMQVNPLSNQGCQAEGWFFKSDDGNADVGTMTKIHDKGGSIGSLSWSGDTLRYTTPSTAYLNMHVSVEYHIFDGGTVVFDTTTQSL